MKQKRIPLLAIALLTGFLLWTTAVCLVDVQPIGPLGSPVGFASINRTFHQLTGVHMELYTLTDTLSLLPIAIALGYLVDPPATMLNAAGDYVVSYIVERFITGKDWLQKKLNANSAE